MQIVHQKDTSLLKKQASQALNNNILSQEGRPLLLLFSGGSAFRLLNEIDPKNLSRRITIGVLDERYSSRKDINNYSHLTTTLFYKAAKKRGCNFIETSVREREKLDQLSERFDKELHEWKKNNLGGNVIITQGIGPDGHTSGIMPYENDPHLFHQLFENPNKWAVGYDAGLKNKYPLRATTTISFLTRIVDVAIVFAAGKSKKTALLNALNPKTKLFQTPAGVIQKMKKVILFTDVSLT